MKPEVNSLEAAHDHDACKCKPLSVMGKQCQCHCEVVQFYTFARYQAASGNCCARLTQIELPRPAEPGRGRLLPRKGYCQRRGNSPVLTSRQPPHEPACVGDVLLERGHDKEESTRNLSLGLGWHDNIRRPCMEQSSDDTCVQNWHITTVAWFIHCSHHEHRPERAPYCSRLHIDKQVQSTKVSISPDLAHAHRWYATQAVDVLPLRPGCSPAHHSACSQGHHWSQRCQHHALPLLLLLLALPGLHGHCLGSWQRQAGSWDPHRRAGMQPRAMAWPPPLAGGCQRWRMAASWPCPAAAQSPSCPRLQHHAGQDACLMHPDNCLCGVCMGKDGGGGSKAAHQTWCRLQAAACAHSCPASCARSASC